MQMVTKMHLAHQGKNGKTYFFENISTYSGPENGQLTNIAEAGVSNDIYSLNTDVIAIDDPGSITGI